MKYFKITCATLIALLVIVRIFFGTAVRFVGPNQAIVTKSYGKVLSKKVSPGSAVKVPIFQQFQTVDLRKQQYTSNPSSLMSRDNILINIGATIIYHPDKDNLDTYVSSFSSDDAVQSRIEDTIYSVLKNTFGQYESKTIFQNLEQIKDGKLVAISENKDVENINTQVTSLTKDKASQYGIVIDDVILTNNMYPESNLKSIYDNITNDRKREADSLLNEGKKQAADIRSDAAKQAGDINNATSLYEQTAKAEAATESKKIRDSVYKTDASFYNYFLNIEMMKKVAEEKSKDGQDIYLNIPQDSPLGKIILGY